MKALIEIQSKLNAPKNQLNKFGNYKYRSCEDILQAVKHLLKENNATLTLSDDIVDICGVLFLKSTATLKADGEIETSAGYAKHPASKKGMDDSQVTGATSSYARKYALNGLFCIDDEKDADTQPPVQHNSQRQQGNNKNTTANTPLSIILRQKGYDHEKILIKLSEQYPDQTQNISTVDNLATKTQSYIINNLNKFGDCKC